MGRRPIVVKAPLRKVADKVRFSSMVYWIIVFRNRKTGSQNPVMANIKNLECGKHFKYVLTARKDWHATSRWSQL